MNPTPISRRQVGPVRLVNGRSGRLPAVYRGCPAHLMIESGMSAHTVRPATVHSRPVLALGALCLGAVGWLAPEWVFSQAMALDGFATSRGLELFGAAVVVVCSLVATSLAGIVTLSPKPEAPAAGPSNSRLRPHVLGALPPITFVGTALLAHGLNSIHGLPPILVVALGAMVQIAIGAAASLLWQLSRRGLRRMVSLLPPPAMDSLAISLLAPRRCPSSPAPARTTTVSRRGPPMSARVSVA